MKQAFRKSIYAEEGTKETFQADECPICKSAVFDDWCTICAKSLKKLQEEADARNVG